MPTIARPPKKPRVKQGKSAEASKLYNTQTWKRLRIAKLMANPLCECPYCKENNLVTAADTVHHIREIQSVDDELTMKQLAFDWDNLMSISAEHHRMIHAEKWSNKAKVNNQD